MTGTGNTLNLSHPRVLQMVMDSLRYWVTSFHVDGFRFDLGVTLGREDDGFDPGAGFFDALRQDPILARVKLISEPWDVGPGGYQLGHIRRDLPNGTIASATARGVSGAATPASVRNSPPGSPARAICSIAHARRPWASINYAASHDGFTLADVVSFSRRHNEANGEDNKDGQAENYSANWGVEGPTDDKVILETRLRVAAGHARDGDVCARHADAAWRRRVRPHVSAATTIPIARTTTFPGGTGTWLIRAEGRQSRTFVAKLIAIRKKHTALRCAAFLPWPS